MDETIIFPTGNMTTDMLILAEKLPYELRLWCN